MSYHNPNHDAPSPSQRSQHNSLSGGYPLSPSQYNSISRAQASGSLPTRVTFPYIKIIPQQLAPTKSKWGEAMQPSAASKPTFQIFFDYVRTAQAGLAGRGVSVAELSLSGVPAIMKTLSNPGDSVLSDVWRHNTLILKLCVCSTLFRSSQAS